MAPRPSKLKRALDQLRDDMRADREAPIILPPAAYEDLRRELGWQPPRRLDSQGATYWEFD